MCTQRAGRKPKDVAESACSEIRADGMGAWMIEANAIAPHLFNALKSPMRERGIVDAMQPGSSKAPAAPVVEPTLQIASMALEDAEDDVRG